MRDATDGDLALLLRAARFAARKHTGQRRKGADGEPYINHPIDVATLLSEEAGVTDVGVLCAALLHDTVEDTDASAHEIRERFGPDIADLVAQVTDDHRLPKAQRKRRQVETAPQASDRAKLLKLADKICNVRDIVHRPPAWPVERRLRYLDWAERVVDGLRGVDERLEQLFDDAVAQGRDLLSD